MSGLPEHIIRDIGRKLADDVTAAAYRNIALVDDRRAAFIVATYGASAAIAAASGACMASLTEPTTAEEAADTLWSILRPMVLGAIADCPEPPERDEAPFLHSGEEG